MQNTAEVPSQSLTSILSAGRIEKIQDTIDNLDPTFESAVADFRGRDHLYHGTPQQ